MDNLPEICDGAYLNRNAMAGAKLKAAAEGSAGWMQILRRMQEKHVSWAVRGTRQGDAGRPAYAQLLAGPGVSVTVPGLAVTQTMYTRLPL